LFNQETMCPTEGEVRESVADGSTGERGRGLRLEHCDWFEGTVLDNSEK